MCNLTVKTILRQTAPHRGFRYEQVRRSAMADDVIEAVVASRKGSRGRCGQCGRPGPTYDRQAERMWRFVPLWAFVVFVVYAPRRIGCARCGIRTERIPWASGKLRICDHMRHFLAQWARRLSWRETAQVFSVSWADVYGAVKWVVDYGRRHRSLESVEALGIDEIHVGRKEKFWTLVYQIDEGCRRLLWVGRDRSAATLERCFEQLGLEFCERIRFVCSDMWRPYIDVAAQCLPNALHILDRFHIVKKMNEAIDEIRRGESRALAAAGPAPLLKKMGWAFLKRRTNWTPGQRSRMRALEDSSLRTMGAFLLVEGFQHFWTYVSPCWAGKFLDAWCRRTMRSRLDPLKKIARSLHNHRPLLMNYFKARKAYSSGVVEGLNNKVKLTVKRAYGFRTAAAREVALYHTLGKLPEPEFTHSFF